MAQWPTLPPEKSGGARPEASTWRAICAFSRSSPSVLVVTAQHRARNLEQFLAMARESGELDFAVAGIGTSSHLAGVRLGLALNVRVTAVCPAESICLPNKSAMVKPEVDAGRIYVEGQWASAGFAWRPSLPAGFAAPGPLIVEDHFATTFVPQDWFLVVHENGTLILTDYRTKA